MSPRKILFIAIAGTILLAILFAFWKLTHVTAPQNKNLTGSLAIWIVWDTTDGYSSLIEGFHEFAPEYKNTTIEFKKFDNYSSYQRILLSTLADQKWPDIFMVDAWADTLLKEKIEPIPEEYIQISDFDKRFDDLFLSLIESSGSQDMLSHTLRWVPLGYETLGIFYNKSLLINTPKIWNDVSNMYTDEAGNGIFPINIGLNPRYTPFATDIVWLFLVQDGMESYTKMDGGWTSLDNYLAYGRTPLRRNTVSGSEEMNATLWNLETQMDEEKLTTLDLFMRGKIAFVIGYPSMVHDLEDAKKRAGSEAINALVLSEKIPQKSWSQSATNIAQYRYFWLSKSSQNSLLWAKFLDYLLTEDAERRFLTSFPLYIPAQRSFYESSRTTSLSSIFSRAKLDAFIPALGEKVVLFDYGNKLEFDKILSDNIDRTSKIDTNNIIERISHTIKCGLVTVSDSNESTDCIQ